MSSFQPGPAWRGTCEHTVVAGRAGILLGFYRLAGEPPVAGLADLFVDPMALGRGVGAMLLADAVHRARAWGVSHLVISADPVPPASSCAWAREGSGQSSAAPSPVETDAIITRGA